ncbi:hypothetical protein EV424DRAFT_521261 [Suillus variegatus]|nr:hypothetical protein EV424DRAFT_521261 [Suillus variegatus]
MMYRKNTTWGPTLIILAFTSSLSVCFAILLHLCKSLIERCTQKLTGKKVRLNMNLSIAISRFLRPFTINFESSRHQASWTTSFTHACIFESMSY